ncbi:hypothetical protein GA0061077_0769 [Bifidobacterium commune]|uniref:Uncharacterized protein n=1 Tax=Bifidobacterium commune TaxID=1505727 RepID=A0A1C4H408_9BIFI|nr:hypothetical protein GA0061077_0769 [Bifidobacterium commune]
MHARAIKFSPSAKSCVTLLLSIAIPSFVPFAPMYLIELFRRAKMFYRCGLCDAKVYALGFFMIESALP